MNAGESVFVLGHRGMLGHVVAAHLEAGGMRVVTSPLRYGGGADDALVREVAASGCGWVVNAIGLIKQKSADPAQLYLLNSVLPQHLLLALAPGQRLIHASTDCVFSGRDGWYPSGARPDAEDVYGLSKALGELVALDPRAIVLRVSIIGPDLGDGAGLLGWFLRQAGPLRGFTNHRWNGITTLEWAKAAREVIAGTAPARAGLVQLGTEQAASKHEMLLLFREVWGRTMEITPCAEGDGVDRTLRPDWVRPPLEAQLRELAVWMARRSPSGGG